MHEVELVKRIRTKLRSAVDIDDPSARPPSEDTIRRVMVATLEILEIRINPDGHVATPGREAEIKALKRAALVNVALSHGHSPIGFSPADHALAAQIRREARTPETSHAAHTFNNGFCLCGEPTSE